MHILYVEKRSNSSPRTPIKPDINDLTQVVPLEGNGQSETLAHFWGQNILDPETVPPPDHGTVILYSGSLNADLNTPDPRNWMSPGFEALERWIADHGEESAAAARQLWFTPSARHILSDIPSTDRFVQQFASDSIGIALEPTALFEADMLAHRIEHLERIMIRLAPLARAIIVSDRAPDPSDDAAPLALTPLSEGSFGLSVWHAIRDFPLSPKVPIIIREPESPDIDRIEQLKRLLQ